MKTLTFTAAVREAEVAIAKCTTTEELRAVDSVTRDRWNAIQRQEARSWRVGQRAKFTGRNGRDVTGEILKVNQKTVQLREDGPDGTPLWGRKLWRVDAGLLTALEPEQKG